MHGFKSDMFFLPRNAALAFAFGCKALNVAQD
jgi:hypothetical protein